MRGLTVPHCPQFPITAIREIKILKQLQNPHVVKLHEIVTSQPTDYNKGKGSIYMVFEYMDHDLTGLMDNPVVHFTPPQIKCYMQQLLNGLHYCHKNGILHRDIKGSNLLINNKGILKLADFGLARPYTEQANANANYTNRVITLWYRPPELLLGATLYGPAIDMWSVGCIFAELLTRKPLFPGRNEFDQLDLIWKKCGTPTEENWTDGQKLPWYHMFQPRRPYQRRLREDLRDCKEVTPDALDLLDRLLTLDPKKRITASDALDQEYFWLDPLPCEPSSLPAYPSSHEFHSKKRRQNQRQDQQGPGPSLAGNPPPAPPHPQGPPNQRPNQTYGPGNPPIDRDRSAQPNGSSSRRDGPNAPQPTQQGFPQTYKRDRDGQVGVDGPTAGAAAGSALMSLGPTGSGGPPKRFKPDGPNLSKPPPQPPY